MNSETRIPQEWLQGVLERTDLVEIVGAELKLERIGKEYRACCPFHVEKTPSFTVNPQKRFFHCFGCGKHGNAVDFLMQHRGVGFRDAVADLARRAGISLPGHSSARDQRSEREVITACRLLHKLFQGEVSTQYERLRVAGIDREVAQHFQLGYAPTNYTVPADSSPALVEAGLLTRDGKPKISDRLVLPVRSGGGATIGLVAVDLPDRAPTPSVVCGLAATWDHLVHDSSQPRVRGEDLFLVLSPLDILPLAALGIVAASIPVTYPLSRHFVRLSRLADRVTFCLPEGRAGEMMAVLAAHQLVNVLDANSAFVRVLFLQPNFPPSQVVMQMGVDTFKERARTAEPLLDVAIRLLSQRLDPLQRDDRRRYLGHMRRFSNASNPAAGFITVDAMMQAWRWSYSEAHPVMEDLGSSMSYEDINVNLMPNSPEVRLLSILLRCPSYVRYIPQMEQSQDPTMRLLREFCGHLRAHPDRNVSRFVETHSQKGFLEQLAVQTRSSDSLVDLVHALEDLRAPAPARRLATMRPS